MNKENKEKPVLCIGGINSTIAKNLVERMTDHWEVCGFLRNKAAFPAELAPKVHLWEADATDPAQVNEAVGQMLERLGRIDAYVHCVGSILLKPLHLTSLEQWEATLATNLHSAFHALQAVLPSMRKQRHGALVFLTSVAARKGLANHEAIAAAKGGLQSMVRSAAATYVSQGIRINAIAPGLLETALSQPILGSEMGRKISEGMHPLGRVGRPDNLTSLIEWLLSPQGDWVTGETFSLDGGMSAIQSKASA